MIDRLPERFLEQARFLLTCDPNEANLRRAVSVAYYALFHLLIRDATSNWRSVAHQGRVARNFDHQRMKAAAAIMIKLIGLDFDQGESGSPEQIARRNIVIVAQAFIELQQSRHKADYDVDIPFSEAEASVRVDQANSAFAAWESAKQFELAQEYLYLLIFKDKP